MTRHYNTQDFTAVIDGERVTLFHCYTTDTRNGFAHHAVSTYFGATDTRQSYYNRTWERFRYESVLCSAIKKLPKRVQETAYAQIIEGKAVEEQEKTEQFIEKFGKLYETLTPENKESLAKSGIEINTEEDAKTAMAIMQFMHILQ